MVTPRCLFAGADDLTLAQVGFRKRYNIGALIIRIGVWGSFSIAILSTNRLSELSDLLLVCSPPVSPFVLHSAMQHTHTHQAVQRPTTIKVKFLRGPLRFGFSIACFSSST